MSTSKTTIYWASQIFGWSIFYLMILGVNIVMDMITPTTNFYFYVIEAILVSILCTHLIRYIIIKYNWLRASILNILLKSITAAIASAIIFESIESIMSLVVPKDFYADSTRNIVTSSKIIGSIIGNSILFSFWLSFYYTYLFVEKSRKQEIKNLKYKASKNEIELKNLREQINPHFLFNSLNSIKALVEIDKDEAKIAITKLSNLLRKSIHLGRKKLITIKEELEIVETYIDLEKIRFEERISSTINVNSNALNCSIPPLMIQTLAENAIKHGLSQTIEGGILDISIVKTNSIVVILIKNTGNLNKFGESEGIGIYNTKKRLNILFGKKAKFKIYQKEDLVCVEIQINYK